MDNILQIAQTIVAAILIITIILQQRGAALGSGFGGEGGTFYSTRRGVEKWIYWTTITSAVLFLALAIANLII
jgi:preprotein translocase subunit SecG